MFTCRLFTPPAWSSTSLPDRASRSATAGRLLPWLIVACLSAGGVADGRDSLIQKEFAVPSGLLPDSTMGLPKSSTLARCIRADMRAVFTSKGVTFPEGSSALYLPVGEHLIVRNTDENLDRITTLVEEFAARNPPPDLTASITVPETHPVPSVCDDSAPNAHTKALLSRIVISRADMKETPLEEAIEWLYGQIRELDKFESQESERGAVFVLTPSTAHLGARITIKLSDVSAIETLKYFVSLANSYYEIDERGRVVIDHLQSGLFMKTERYRIPAAAVIRGSGVVHGPDGVDYPSVRELFTAFGVAFSDGASAGLATDKDCVVMRNTEENLEIAEVVVAGLIDANGGKLASNHIRALQKIIQDLKVNRR